MVIGMFAEDFKKAVKQASEKTEAYTSSGKCTSHEEYKAKCGEIAGLKSALEIFNNVVKRHGELEDDE